LECRNFDPKNEEIMAGRQPTNCVCKKESELGKLKADVETLKKAVMGNGQPGLIVTVPRLAESVEQFEKTAGEFATAVRGFHQFQENQIGQATGKETVRKRNRWIIGILITLSTSLMGTVIFLMLKLFHNLPTV
jgi:hypothetical protein